MLREVFVKNQKVCARSSSIRYIPPDICTASTMTVTHTHTLSLSSLPSQCFLATASNSLHLSLVHSAGQTTSLKWSIPCLTARYMDRRKTHCCPSQQHLSQIPHWSVWLSLWLQSLCVSTHSLTVDPGWADGSRPGSSPGMQARLGARQRERGDKS